MMATDVILPALGMSQDTGKIVQWLKAEGEQVAKGEPLAEIETDKATVEIEAPDDGVLARIIAAAGDDIPVGQVIATILAPGETLRKEPVSTYSPQQDKVAVSAPMKTASQSPLVAASLLASPKARRLANEQGKNLASIRGSGPDGAVLAADVLAALVSPIANSANEISLSTTWRLMAERTTQSWTNVPHFYLMREVNASRLIVWREQSSKHSVEKASHKVTYTDLLVKIVAQALQMHPHLHASWSGKSITFKPEIHIGLAVAHEEGLVVPVIHHADRLSIDEIAQRRVEMVEKARSGKLRPQDISGATFTISNLGMYNVDAFYAIINQPQGAILAAGRIADRVVPLNGQVAIQPMMVLTLSCDHRSIDGVRGAQFLDTVTTLLEEPRELLN